MSTIRNEKLLEKLQDKTKDYKINNDYKPFYSRLFMAEHKQYENFFRKRGSHADNIDWSSYVVQESHSAAKVS